jgi:hypothetical protein
MLAGFSIVAAAQAPSMLKRTNTQTDTIDFGSGGSITITGAPAGSVTVEGWQKNKIEITAEIEVQGETEADLAALSAISGYLLDDTMGHTSITSLLPNKRALKGKDKKTIARLLATPFRIDYHIKVPRFSDLEINGGEGDLAISGVDGAMRIKFLKSNARLDLVGGVTSATFGGGTVEVIIPDRSWRGRSADIQLAAGTMNVHLPVSLNAEVDATILRTGKIETSYAAFTPRERKLPFTDKSMIAKAGSGGIPLKFTVGDGTLNFSDTKK